MVSAVCLDHGVYCESMCLSYALCCDKILQQKKLMGKAFVLVYHYLRTQFTMAGKAWQQEQETGWPHCIQTQRTIACS